MYSPPTGKKRRLTDDPWSGGAEVSSQGDGFTSEAATSASTDESFDFMADDSAEASGPQMMAVMKWTDNDPNDPLALEHVGNIFIEDPTMHIAKCVIAFFDENYSINLQPCSSIAEWRDEAEGSFVNITTISSVSDDIKNAGHQILLKKEAAESQISSTESNPQWLEDITAGLQRAKLDDELVEVKGKLNGEQIYFACELLDTFLYIADTLFFREDIMAFPYVNNPKMKGVVEGMSIKRFTRIYSLAWLLRTRLDVDMDDNTTQELKYCTEHIYEGYSDKKGCLERDLEKICSYLNLSPCELGAATTPLRRAYGPFYEETSDGDFIDWRISQDRDEGLGRTITNRYRNNVDGVEDSIKRMVPTNGPIKCIFYTEDLAMYKLFRKVYEELGLVVVHTKGFSDRNTRGYIKLLNSCFFPDAEISALVDLDLPGLRQIQANLHTENLTNPRAAPRHPHDANYSFESRWIGILPSEIQRIREEDNISVPSTAMEPEMVVHLKRFMEHSAFPVCGDAARREEELSLMYEMKEVVKMEQVDPTFLCEHILNKLKRGDYGC